MREANAKLAGLEPVPCRRRGDGVSRAADFALTPATNCLITVLMTRMSESSHAAPE